MEKNKKNLVFFVVVVVAILLLEFFVVVVSASKFITFFRENIHVFFAIVSLELKPIGDSCDAKTIQHLFDVSM